jgi:hypothetical protein
VLDRCQEGEVADDADDLLAKVEEVRLEAMEVLKDAKEERDPRRMSLLRSSRIRQEEEDP